MNKTLNIPIKYLLLAVVVFLLLFYYSFIANNNLPEDKVTETTKTEVKTIKKVDSGYVKIKTKPSKETIAFLVDSITKSIRIKPTKKQVSENKVSPKKETEKEVEAFVFKDTTKLKNATIVSTIVSPCNVLKVDLKAFTEDKHFTTTKTKETIKYRVPNVWFFNVEPTFSMLPTPAFAGAELSIDYTIKNKFRIGTGIEYNTLLPKNQQFLFNLKIGFPL